MTCLEVLGHFLSTLLDGFDWTNQYQIRIKVIKPCHAECFYVEHARIQLFFTNFDNFLFVDF